MQPRYCCMQVVSHIGGFARSFKRGQCQAGKIEQALVAGTFVGARGYQWRWWAVVGDLAG